MTVTDLRGKFRTQAMKLAEPVPLGSAGETYARWGAADAIEAALVSAFNAGVEASAVHVDTEAEFENETKFDVALGETAERIRALKLPGAP